MSWRNVTRSAFSCVASYQRKCDGFRKRQRCVPRRDLVEHASLDIQSYCTNNSPARFMSSTSGGTVSPAQNQRDLVALRRMKFLGFETEETTIPTRCFRTYHSMPLADIIATTIAPWMTEGGKVRPVDSKRQLEHELNRMPHLFHHNANEMKIIKTIMEEFISALQDYTHPCLKHIQGAPHHVSNDHNFQWILLQVLIRLPRTVIQIAGKKLDAKSRNECYIPSLQDIREVRQECRESGVDPYRDGSVYLLAFFLKNKDELLLKDLELPGGEKERISLRNLKKLIKKSKVFKNGDLCTILYIGLSTKMIERFVGYKDFPWDFHFKSAGMNGILLRMLEEKEIQGDVILFPIVNTHCTSLLGLFEAVTAATWSLDRSLLWGKGNSTNMVGCGRTGFDRDEEGWMKQLDELKEYKTKHGDCNVPYRYKANPG